MTCAAAVRQGWEGANRFFALLGMTVKSIWRVQMLDGGNGRNGKRGASLVCEGGMEGKADGGRERLGER